MLSGENHDVRWIAAHERLKSYGCDQKAAALLPASKLEARVRVRLKHLKMLQSTKSKAHFSDIPRKISLLYKIIYKLILFKFRKVVIFSSIMLKFPKL